MIEQNAKMNGQWTKLNELEKEMIEQKRTSRKRSDQNKWAKSDLFEWAGTERKNEFQNMKKFTPFRAKKRISNHEKNHAV